MRVAIEIGHEDVHPGATRDGVREVDPNRALAQVLAALGDDDITYEIWQRPTTDDGLEVVRQALAEDPPDLVISLHHNALEDQTVHGTILFYDPEHAQSGQVVSYIQRQAQRLGGGFASLGGSVRSSGRGNSRGNSYPLRRSGRYGAVLVEVGFMSSPDNLERVQTDQFRREAAAQLHGAIRQFGVAAGLLAAEAPSRPASTSPTLGHASTGGWSRGRLPVHHMRPARRPGGPPFPEPRIAPFAASQPVTDGPPGGAGALSHPSGSRGRLPVHNVRRARRPGGPRPAERRVPPIFVPQPSTTRSRRRGR